MLNISLGWACCTLQGLNPRRGMTCTAVSLLFYRENWKASLQNNLSVGASCLRDCVPELGMPAAQHYSSWKLCRATNLKPLMQASLERAIRSSSGYSCLHLHTDQDVVLNSRMGERLGST